MYKSLILVRHAKSSWDDPFLPDIARPLGERGHKDAPAMAKYIKGEGMTADLLLSSPADRAFSTAKYFAVALGKAESNITTDGDIYHASEKVLLKIIQQQDDRYKTIMMFGHNPGFTGFANELANLAIENIPTCGVIGLRFEVSRWRDVAFGGGYKIFYYTPKGIYP